MSLRLFLSIGLTVFGFGLFCEKAQSYSNNRFDGVAKKVMCITIPKSGSHLLLKCLNLMGLPYKYDEVTWYQKWSEHKEKYGTMLKPNGGKMVNHPCVGSALPRFVQDLHLKKQVYQWTHFSYTSQFNSLLNHQGFKKFLMLRDPRAVVVSYVNMVNSAFDDQEKLDIELLLLDLIDGKKKNYIPWMKFRHHLYPIICDIGICEFYTSYLPFISKTCLTVRFEDLVGLQGGGSDEAQMDTIKKIAEHINVPINNQKVLDLVASLFGNSATFQGGKIDSWKKYFTPKVKKAFKAVPGANQLLIDLGYEKNSKW